MPIRYSTILVEGASMEPTYSSGDWLLVRWGSYRLGGSGSLSTRRVKVGDVVLIEREEQPGIHYLKRISDVRENSQEIFLLSDNESGSDSRTWGWLPIDNVRARVLFRVKCA